MSTTAQLGEAISAASLVLAVLAALYTLWLHDVSAALSTKPEQDKDDRGPQRDKVLSALLTKAFPLTLATVAAFLILSPRATSIIKEVVCAENSWQFNDVKALFVLTWALIFLLAVVATSQTVGLIKTLRMLGSR